MNKDLKRIKTAVYDKCGLILTDYALEDESKDYDACRLVLNGLNVVSRSAKITPKKTGQFVTFWQRNCDGIIEPFSEVDSIDFFVINVHKEKRLGQFVFPKSVLMAKGIISTKQKEGKRGFRVYPPWDIANNKQAEKTQKWQLQYFYEIAANIDFKQVLDLYKQED